MEKLLREFVEMPRFNNSGKDVFRGHINEWSKKNLSNFKFEVENNRFVIDLLEAAKIIFLYFNFVAIFYLIFSGNTQSVLDEIICMILLYGIQIRIMFFFLNILIPSKNIILSKDSKTEKKKDLEFIVCAHYDTKNSLIKKKKGRVRTCLKYNLLGISRLVSKYIFMAEKLAVPISVFVYVWNAIYPMQTAETAFYADYSKLLISFAYEMGTVLLVYGLLCSILIYLITLPIGKDIKNPGADDNTSGVVGALEIARRINDCNLDFDFKVILFDNEERGLVGSSHFVVRNLRRLRNKKSQVINLDCIGRGADVCLSTNTTRHSIISPLFSNMKAKQMNYEVADIDFSDHKPFLKAGIEAVSLGRYNYKRYLWSKKFPMIDWIHGSEDCIEDIDIQKIQQIVDVVVNTVKFK